MNRDANGTKEWRPVLGYEGYYEVSSSGRVRSLPRTITDTRGVQKPVHGKIMRLSSNKGRLYVLLCRNGRHQAFTVHRLVAEAFIGPRSEGIHIHHRDHNPTNNRVDNLEYVTAKQNIAYSKERINAARARGEQIHTSKLTEADVRNIRKGYRIGRAAALAREYGVSSSAVGRILSRETWKHVD